jgi:hypothetical protein
MVEDADSEVKCFFTVQSCWGDRMLCLKTERAISIQVNQTEGRG